MKPEIAKDIKDKLVLMRTKEAGVTNLYAISYTIQQTRISFVRATDIQSAVNSWKNGEENDWDYLDDEMQAGPKIFVISPDPLEENKSLVGYQYADEAPKSIRPRGEDIELS